MCTYFPHPEIYLKEKRELRTDDEYGVTFIKEISHPIKRCKNIQFFNIQYMLIILNALRFQIGVCDYKVISIIL